jgi:hypothetical protein
MMKVLILGMGFKHLHTPARKVDRGCRHEMVVRMDKALAIALAKAQGWVSIVQEAREA